MSAACAARLIGHLSVVPARSRTTERQNNCSEVRILVDGDDRQSTRKKTRLGVSDHGFCHIGDRKLSSAHHLHRGKGKCASTAGILTAMQTKIESPNQKFSFYDDTILRGKTYFRYTGDPGAVERT